VLDRACRDHVAWAGDRPDLDVDLAVNVSAHQLMTPGFSTDVAAVIERTGMDASRLILEVTENVLIDESTLVLTVLDDLRRHGIRIALDDFGTGYSSLSYLRRLPVQIVKVDQSFVADIDGTPAGSAIAAAVTTMAHDLELTVVAEGVETASQREGVRAMGCDWAQGLLFAAPMPAPAVARRLVGGMVAG
jgi:EAL domain-containing protein (putative c-di-GMP-specific phosphodiesterase class I)